MKQDGRCPSRNTYFRTNRVSSRQNLPSPKSRRQAATGVTENTEKYSLFSLLLLQLCNCFSCRGKSLACKCLTFVIYLFQLYCRVVQHFLKLKNRIAFGKDFIQDIQRVFQKLTH